MFETSLLESSGRLRSRPGWTTTLSLALQSLLLGLLVLIPLLRTDALPSLHAVIRPLLPPPGPAARSAVAAQPRGGTTPSPSPPATAILQPDRIPTTIARIVDAPPSGPPQVGELGGCTGVCVEGGIPHPVGEVLRSVPVPQAPAPPQRVVMSGGVTAGYLIHRVQPAYPSIARLAGIEGTVILHAIISKTGTIESLRVVSGHPTLQPAALEAVRRWRYRPFLLSSAPVQVETQITVNFVLSRDRP